MKKFYIMPCGFVKGFLVDFVNFFSEVHAGTMYIGGFRKSRGFLGCLDTLRIMYVTMIYNTNQVRVGC